MPNDQSFDKTSKPFELTRQSANSSSLSCAPPKAIPSSKASPCLKPQRKWKPKENKAFMKNRIYKYDIRNFNDSSKLLTPKIAKYLDEALHSVLETRNQPANMGMRNLKQEYRRIRISDLLISPMPSISSISSIPAISKESQKSISFIRHVPPENPTLADDVKQYTANGMSSQVFLPVQGPLEFVNMSGEPLNTCTHNLAKHRHKVEIGRPVIMRRAFMEADLNDNDGFRALKEASYYSGYLPRRNRNQLGISTQPKHTRNIPKDESLQRP